MVFKLIFELSKAFSINSYPSI